MNEVEKYLNNLKHPFKKSLLLIRENILKVDSKIEEHIKWNAPSFTFNGEDFMTYGLHKPKAISLVFHRGVKKSDKIFKYKEDFKILEWKSPDRAIVNFKSEADVTKNLETLSDLAKKWIKG